MKVELSLIVIKDVGQAGWRREEEEQEVSILTGSVFI